MGRQGVRVVAATVAAVTLAAAPTAAAHDLTSSQARVFEQRLHKSRTVVNWWNHRGRWALFTRYGHCWQVRASRRHQRICRVARASLAAHQARRDRLERLLAPPRPTTTLSYWIGRQIYAATVIGRESAGDPWPNCPDPFDGGGSWDATVACENGGDWLDSPGYFRCGLQFEPMWERRFGRLCP